jgi:hypothetical protein
MTHRIARGRYKGLVVIRATAPETCELCGTVAECRPYGPHGETICIECARKDVATTERRMDELMTGKKPCRTRYT